VADRKLEEQTRATEGAVAQFVEWLNSASMDEDAKYAWDNGFPYSWVCLQAEKYLQELAAKLDGGIE